MNVFTLPFMLHAHKCQKKSRLNSCRLRRRCGGAILTPGQTNRACTLALVPPPCLFVLFFPQGAPPALGQLWKSCRRWCSRAESVSQGGGSGCRPEISNRHAESKTGGTGPRTAARRRGRVLPAGNTLSINMLPGQIWFHSGMCVTVAQSTRIRLGAARLLIHLLRKCWFYVLKYHSHLFLRQRELTYSQPLTHTLVLKLLIWIFIIAKWRGVLVGYDMRSNK